MSQPRGSGKGRAGLWQLVHQKLHRGWLQNLISLPGCHLAPVFISGPLAQTPSEAQGGYGT